MLINCKECGLQVSDKALMCPHCGFPLSSRLPVKRKYNKRKRLPNGFGQISEIKGRGLRNPFRAMVTVGISPETGRPICKLLKPVSYFQTYNDAYQALVAYHTEKNSPIKNILFEDLYELWLAEYKERGNSQSAVNIVEMARNYCTPLVGREISKLRTEDIKDCLLNAYRIDRSGNKKLASFEAKRRVKTLLNNLFDYAIAYDYAEKNYAKLCQIGKTSPKPVAGHCPYTKEEMAILWNHAKDNEIARFVIVQCYSGWRPDELVKLAKENINFDSGYMIGGSKTEAGTNRKVPIHSAIYDLLRQEYDRSSKATVFSFPNYGALLYKYNCMLKELGIDSRHRPHDGRVTFVTMAKNSCLDEYAIKHIVGHTISDLTERVYTSRPASWLSEEIEKIKGVAL